jgi:hypothetical protein
VDLTQSVLQVKEKILRRARTRIRVRARRGAMFSRRTQINSREGKP